MYPSACTGNCLIAIGAKLNSRCISDFFLPFFKSIKNYLNVAQVGSTVNDISAKLALSELQLLFSTYFHAQCMKSDFLKCIFLNCGRCRDKIEFHSDFVVFVVPVFTCPLMSPGRKEAENVCARQYLSNKILLSDKAILHCPGNFHSYSSEYQIFQLPLDT